MAEEIKLFPALRKLFYSLMTEFLNSLLELLIFTFSNSHATLYKRRCKQ